ncbi:hypothetical protein [Rhizobium phage RHEph12]|nr:hypothetical protein [Rhizobium phage RHEph12]
MSYGRVAANDGQEQSRSASHDLILPSGFRSFQMFMQGVKNQWNMALTIGGKDFKADPSTVRQCLWFENIHQHLPTLNLELIDVNGDFLPSYLPVTACRLISR